MTSNICKTKRKIYDRWVQPAEESWLGFMLEHVQVLYFVNEARLDKSISWKLSKTEKSSIFFYIFAQLYKMAKVRSGNLGTINATTDNASFLT